MYRAKFAKLRAKVCSVKLAKSRAKDWQRNSCKVTRARIGSAKFAKSREGKVGRRRNVCNSMFVYNCNEKVAKTVNISCAKVW